MELTALKLALLAAAADAESAPHALHGELEHWLNRQLSSEELEATLAELAAAGLVAQHLRGFVTTETGRALVAAEWETFFPA